MESESKKLLKPVSDLPTRINEYTCSTCGKVSFQSEFLSKYYRIRGNYAFQKNQKFFMYDGPIENICSCANVKPFKCEVCNKSFARKGTLKTHCRTHTAEKPFQCEMCDRNFRFRGQLDNHVVTHSKERPYRCPVCSNCFGQAAQFKKHCRSHTKEKTL